MANITIATAANFIPEVWSTLIEEAMHNNLVAANLVDRRYEKFARDGDTIHVPHLDEISARTLTNMTGALTFDANTEDVTNISVDTFAYIAIKVDDAARIQSMLPELELYTTEIGRGVAEKIDTDVFTAADGTTHSVGTDNYELGEDEILDAREQLDKTGVPSGDRFLIVSAQSKQDMFRVEKWTNSLSASSIGNLAKDASKGYLGNLYDFGLYMSTKVPAGSAGHKNFMWHRGGVALVIQDGIKVTTREPHDEFAMAIRARAIYGTKLMDKRDMDDNTVYSVVEVLGR